MSAEIAMLATSIFTQLIEQDAADYFRRNLHGHGVGEKLSKIARRRVGGEE